ncbi:FG-GAP-like repeat-containing protein [Shewanella marisflavi]|nr:SpvB/TcaC N-terminal domain-containing protein [Shewanella marisflavi]MCL1043690.1 FG-GAP-like repeat-containing protein [Shewanella marisflavi]
MTITRASSNTTLLPTANVILGGSGGSRTLTLKPAANQYGTSTVTVNVSDGTTTTSRSFVLTVNSVNDAPVVSVIANQSTNEDVNKAVSFTISDVETAATSLTISRSSSNTTLLPTANVILGGSGGSRTLTLKPAANQYGTSTVTVNVSDGTTTTSRSFVLTVNSVNDAPVVSAIANQSTNEDVNKAVSFTISDVETAATSLTITRASSNTTLLPTANVILGGSGGSRTLTLKPAANQYGTSTVAVNVSDGTVTTSRSFVLTVNSVNDAPVVSVIANQSTNEDVNKAVSFTISDVETAATSLTITRASSNTTLLPTANVILGGSGGSRTLTLKPAANKYGTSTVTVNVSDGTTTTSRNFDLTVNSVDDAPTVSLTLSAIVKESQPIVVSASASDIDSVIEQVEFSLDGVNWVSDTTAPYSQDFGLQPLGNYSISTRALSNGKYSDIQTGSVKVEALRLRDISSIPDGNNSEASPESNELVGEIKAQASVDGGAFSYSVPITIAPGRKGVQPSISLNYSSQSGDGLVGLGWSLSAYSSISRCGQIYDLDKASSSAHYSNDDKLCYNGARLVPVVGPSGGSIGAYGEFGTYYKKERNGTEYIQQLGGSLDSGKAYFEVYMTDGSVIRLGSKNNSRKTAIGLTLPMSWLQDRFEDRFGNQIHYSYRQEVISDGNRYIEDIFYTGFDDAYGSRKVHFSYEDKPLEVVYHWGGKTLFSKRLSKISTISNDIELAYWELNYDIPVAEALNDAQKLTSLKYCDARNEDSCLSTEFDWYERLYSHTKTNQHALSGLGDNHTVGFPVSKSSDYDGDGVADLSMGFDIYLSSTNSKLDTSNLPRTNGPDSFQDLNGDGIFNADEKKYNDFIGMIDYNLDGRDDFVVINPSRKVQVVGLENNGDVSFSHETNVTANCYDELGVLRVCLNHILDLNGDGRKDLIVADSISNGNVTYKAYVREEVGADFYYAGSFSKKIEDKFTLMDIDGDGMADLVPPSFENKLEWIKVNFDKVNKTVAFEDKTVLFDTSDYSGYRSKFSKFADFNGDGLLDVLTLKKADSSDNYFTRYVAFNKGAGAFSELVSTGLTELAFTYNNLMVSSSKPGYVYEQFIKFVDYNGDGRQDILYPDYDRKKYIYQCFDANNDEPCGEPGSSEPKRRFYDYDVWYWNVLITEPDGKSYKEEKLDVYGALATMSVIDINGDGRSDFVSGLGWESDAQLSTWTYPDTYPTEFVAFIHDDTQDSVIKSISTGFGVKHQIEYKRLNNDVYTLSRTENDYPYLNFGNTMRVVSKLETDNGVGGYNSTKYHYENARFHIGGRGFQGFSAITETNEYSNSQLGQIVKTEFEQVYPLSGMVRQKTTTDLNGNLLGLYTVEENYPASSDYTVGESWCFYPSKTETKWYAPSLLTEITTETFAQTKTSLCQSETVSKTVVDGTTEYAQHVKYGYVSPQPLLSLLSTTTTSSSVSYESDAGATLTPEQLNVSTVKTNSYDSEKYGFVVLQSTTLSDEAKTPGVSSTVSFDDYDVYGQALSQTIGTRWTKKTMDSEGYFVVSTANSEWGDNVVAASYTNDPLTGAVLTSTDISQVTTENTINFIGQVLQTDATKGEVQVTPPVYNSVQWADAPYSYKTIVRSSGKPEQVSYFDSKNRLVKQVTAGFSGDIVSSKSYDAMGNLLTETIPTSNYGTVVATTYTDYDVLGRPGSKTFDDGIVNYVSTYDYLDGLTTEINVVSGGYNFNVSRTYNSLKQLISTVDAKGNSSEFAYNAAGLPVLIKDVLGSEITAVYDDLGRKKSFSDPNMGTWSFTYNIYGEIDTQTDARGIVTTHEYDDLGRLINRGGRKFIYDDIAVGNGFLYQTDYAGEVKTFSYDSAGRNTQTVTTIDGNHFVEKYAYDNTFGRLKAVQFPSGEHVAYTYDDNGYLIEDYQAFDDNSIKVLRTIDKYSAQGGINQQTYSNGLIQNIIRNDAGSARMICTSGSGDCNALIGEQFLEYDYDSMGNLAFQHNQSQKFKESYSYDELMRVQDATIELDGLGLEPFNPIDYDYDAAGNITIKSDYGEDYRYGNVGKTLGGLAGPNAIRQFVRGGTTYQFTYDANGNRLTGDGLALSYNDDNKPMTVKRNGVTSTFSYGADGTRFKQVKEVNGESVITYYVGSFEREVTASATIEKTYIGDHTIKMKAVVGSLGNKSPFQHILRDRLGGVDTLIDATSGSVLQRRGYDVFGRPRDLAGGNDLLKDWQGVYRGFTDHEHLAEQELIHMNGRIYDFNVGRFLSVDPFLQFPENSQSANPYSYILNNPMAGTDPTGYMAEASNWRTRECDLAPMGCQSTPVSRLLDKWGVSNGQSNESLAKAHQQRRRDKESAGKWKEAVQVATDNLNASVAKDNRSTNGNSIWTDSDGNPTSAPKNFNGTELACAFVCPLIPVAVEEAIVGIGLIAAAVSSGDDDKALEEIRHSTTGMPGGGPDDDEEHNRGSNDAQLTNKEADKILREKGYKPQQGLKSQKNTVYYNPKGSPKYLVRSNTSHTGDAFKGYNSPKDIKLKNRTGSYDVNLKRTGK